MKRWSLPLRAVSRNFDLAIHQNAANLGNCALVSRELPEPIDGRSAEGAPVAGVSRLASVGAPSRGILLFGG
jgi:hypothetical protein